MQFELAEAFKSILTQPDLVKPLVDLLVEAFKDPEVGAGLNALLESCFHKILLDKDTIDKFRIFVYNLMSMELEDSKGRNSSLLDLMLNKAVNRGSTKGRSDIETIIQKERQRDLKDKITTIEKNTAVPEEAITPEENLDVKKQNDDQTQSTGSVNLMNKLETSSITVNIDDSDSESASDNTKVL